MIRVLQSDIINAPFDRGRVPFFFFWFLKIFSLVIFFSIFRYSQCIFYNKLIRIKMKKLKSVVWEIKLNCLIKLGTRVTVILQLYSYINFSFYLITAHLIFSRFQIPCLSVIVISFNVLRWQYLTIHLPEWQIKKE